MMIEYKPTVTLGGILQLIAILGGAISVYTSIVSRTAVLETQQANSEKQRVERNAETDRRMDELSTKVDVVDQKLTRLLINDHNRANSR